MSDTPTSPPKTESLSLSEMMRIMDVATEIRHQRETVEKEFAVDETRRLLREKLLQTTAITGERVTEAEVDAAIESYFSTLYTYQEPKGSLALMLARFYVRRGQFAMISLLVLTLVGTGWWTVRIARTRFSPIARATRQSVRIEKAINLSLASIRAVARDPAVIDDVNNLEQEAKVAREQLDTDQLASLENRLSQLSARLNEAYEVRILADPQERSGFTQTPDDQPDGKAYYLIVSAKNDRGEVIRHTIDDSQVLKPITVDRWAEQVPKAVYDRIAADKKADGILNETLFAVKRRGYPAEEIRLPDADGNPLNRLGQIAKW
jgi:hypothetical protein